MAHWGAVAPKTRKQRTHCLGTGSVQLEFPYTASYKRIIDVFSNKIL